MKPCSKHPHARASSQIETQKRRAAQPLFNALGSHLGAFSGKTIALAVSGGLDSRALMEGVAHWPLRHQFPFVVVVVNHQTRKDSSAEARAVAARAASLGLECHIQTLFVSSSQDEATLRHLRYDAIWSFLKSRDISVLCTAHQKNDDAEGVFMDLFGFGGGHNGESMGALKHKEEGTHLRPFLELQRRDLHLFLTSIGVTDYFLDPSNENGSCLRQRARDFIQQQGSFYHPRPVERLAHVANRRINEPTSGPSLMLQLQQAYKEACPERDPRDAAPAIASIVKKARSFTLSKPGGVDPSANSITVSQAERLSFDLPGAKVLMTPAFFTLYRNQTN